MEGTRRTPWLILGLVALVAMIAAPSFVGRIHYARTRAELAAIRDSAANAELRSVGKLFTTLARIIGPSVVNVTATRRVRTLADEIRALRGVDGQGLTDESIGSGVIVDAAGVILTNYHVVAHVDGIRVQLSDGRDFEARLVGGDAASDLAVLRVDADNLPAAAWGDSDLVEVGEMAWAIGNPFGLDRTITYGIVSGVGRRGVTGNPFQEFLQTDASINPGNSGGPLVDVHGRVVGITTAIAGRESRGIGFAIPSNTAKRVTEEILAHGHVERGYFGIALRELPPTLPERQGALVVAVEPESPAALAEIEPGDVITAFDGEEILDPAVLVLYLTRAPIGETVKLEIVRGEKRRTIDVRVGRRPKE